MTTQKSKSIKEISNLAATIIREKANEWAPDMPGGLYGFLATNLLFGTITLNTNFINVPSTFPRACELCLDVTRLQYLAICRQLLGSHFSSNRNIPLQPITVAFVDLDKATRSIGSYSSGSNPHPHFVSLFHPLTDPMKVLSNGRFLSERYRMPTKDKRVSTFDLERFDQDKGSLDDLSAYISKTATHRAFASLGEGAFQLYPEKFVGQKAHLSYASRTSASRRAVSEDESWSPELERFLDEICR